MTTPTTERPRPPREQQAWDEIGHTDFASGVPAFLVGFFLILLTSVPLIQVFTPAEAFQELAGYQAPELEEPLIGMPVHATVAAVSRPPDPNGVYTDFLMQLHLTDATWIDQRDSDSEVLVSVVAMRNRIIQPVARLQPGMRINLRIADLSEAGPAYQAINGSKLDDDRFLAMETRLGTRVMNPSFDAWGPTANDFLGVWKGEGADLPPDARVPVAQGMKTASAAADTALRRFLGANGHLAQRTRLYEDALDDSSVLSLALRSPVQAMMVKLGVGNEKANVGEDGWLFYTPGVHSVSGPGFLEPEQLQRRSREGATPESAPQPDPRLAIIDFHKQLEERGITLIVMPTPNKASIHPERLAPGLPSDTVIRNPSFDQFVIDLKDAGVKVYDPAPLLMKRKADGPQYLRTDTHWNPGAMKAVAEEVVSMAAGILGAIPVESSVVTPAESAAFTQLGDIGTMLELPDEQSVIETETVAVTPVMLNKTTPLPPVEGNAILLLGDSFANIFSLGSMGWGSHAGLSEQMSLHIEYPIDRLSRNDAGAYASREMLVNALRKGEPRLLNTKVVVWQFAERELALGDWKLLNLPKQPEQDTTPEPPVTNAVPRVGAHPQTIRDTYSSLVKEAGDATVIKGTDDWLFLVNELEHLAHGPFWGEHVESTSQDPLYSIVDLNTKLKELGIDLILAPAPPRAVIYADRLFSYVPVHDGIPMRMDPDLQTFYAELRKQGVTVVDVTDAMLAARKDDATLGPVSCEQDSHWSPRGQQILAEAIRKEIGDQAWIRPHKSLFRQDPEELTYTGDLVSLMSGMEGHRSSTRITRVTEDGEIVKPDPTSPVILLADSHGLIFSAGGDMHTTGAGLGEQLAHELGMPIDIMARKGSGAGVRRDLAKRFIRTPEQAQGRKVLIYCFAARTFTGPDSWKVVPLQKK